MKKFAAGIVIVGALASVGCSTRIEPGHVGIVVNYSGTDRGVDSYPIRTGRVWYNPYSERIIEYPVFVQTAKWTASMTEGKAVDESVTFTNKDGMQFAADISLSYHLVADAVPVFYVKFRAEDLGGFTHNYLRNVARDKFDTFGGRYSIEQIMGDNAEFLKHVREAVQEEVKSIGVVIDQFGLIGAPRPPAQIQKSINDKASAQQLAQQKENELKQAEADARKVVATAEGAALAARAEAEGEANAIKLRADANATANRKLSESITPSLLELKRLEKWNGELPYINGGSTNPFVSIEKRQ